MAHFHLVQNYSFMNHCKLLKFQSSSNEPSFFKASPERSMSSANWPSILNTHELDSKSAGNLYKDIGKRPRDPLPFEANKEVDNSSDTSSFRHQHTHHHYHHYSAPLPTNSRPKLSNSSVGRGSPPKSTVKTVKSDMHDGISSESKRLTMQEKIKSKGDVSSIIIGETRLNFNKKGKCSM